MLPILITLLHLISLSVAAPIVSQHSYSTKNILLGRQGDNDKYPLQCNTYTLPPNEIEDCANELIARGNEVLKIEKMNEPMHLCERPHVFVQGRVWGEGGGGSAKAVDAGNVVKGILAWCGNRGGSFAPVGQQGPKSFVVHVADHWV